MNSITTGAFWKCYSVLTESVRKQAKATYKQFQKDPYYPSLHFKQVHSTRPIYSVRISKDYRAVGIIQGEEIIWFWIGIHSDKMTLKLGQLKNLKLKSVWNHEEHDFTPWLA